MRRVYVVTDARRNRLRAGRAVTVAVLLMLFAVLTLVGHVAVLLLGALDALVTAWLGAPRIARCSRCFADVVRQTWEEGR